MSRYRYTISQVKKMNKLLQKSADEIMEKVGQDTVNRMKVFIRLYWYNRYQPTSYERTYSLMNAASYEIQNGEVRIFIDETKFEYRANDYGWGQHVGFDGEDFGEGLVEFIETGSFKSGKVGSRNNPRIGKGSGAMEKTIRWLNKYVNTEVKKRLSILIGAEVI